MITIKNINTNYIFQVNDNVGLEMLANFKGTLEAVKYNEDLKDKIKNIYLENDLTSDEERLLGNNKKTMNDYTIPELKAELNKLGITYASCAKKLDLYNLLLNNTDTDTDTDTDTE